MTGSMRLWSEARRRRSLLVCMLIAIPVAVLTAVRIGGFFTQSDSGYYLAIAAGRNSMLPFASRQLGPLCVRALSHLTHLSVENAFFAEGSVSLMIFFGTVMWLALRSGAPRWMLGALAGMFFWSSQFNSLVLPDLFYAALLCVFLLLLRQERMMLAALMMFPLAVARESTLLTVACLLIAGWRRLRWRESAVAVLATTAGILVVKLLTVNALPNIEHISPGLYLMAKMPWNFVRNFLGVVPWANVYPLCTVPVWTREVHLGPLQRIGLCGWSAVAPAMLLYEALVTFGLLPLLVWRVRVVRGGLTGGSGGVLMRFCVVYGVISFALAGVLGEAFGRLFGYSWPLCLVALPILISSTGGNFKTARAAMAFLALHLSLTWMNLEVNDPWLVLVALGLWGAGWWLLRQTWQMGLPVANLQADSRTNT